MIWTWMSMVACLGGDPPEGNTLRRGARAAPAPAPAGPASARSLDLPTCAEDALTQGYAPAETHAVRTVDRLKVIEPVTGRTIELLVRLPEGATGALPVVIWSHGGEPRPNGRTQGSNWGQTLATAGYAVLHVGHIPFDCPRRDACPDSSAVLSLCEHLGLPGGDSCLGTPYPFLSRPVDLRAVIGALGEISATLSDRGGEPVSLDTERLGLVGWSAGTFGVGSLNGTVRMVGPDLHRLTTAHPGHAAAVLLSPPGPCSHGGFCTPREIPPDCQPATTGGCPGESSWDGVTGPTLLVTGAGDCKKKSGITGPGRARTFDLLPDGEKHLLYLSDDACRRGGACNGCTTSHGSFDLRDCDRRDPRTKAMVSAVVAFLDAHLLERSEARAFLASDQLVSIGDDQVTWRSR